MKGLKPYYAKSKKDYAFHATFGAAQLSDIPNEFFIGNGLNTDDQGATPFCTAYTMAELCANIEGIEFSEDYQYAKTLELASLPATQQGVDMKMAAEVPVTIGVLPKNLAPLNWRKDGQNAVADYRNWPQSLEDIAAKYKEGAYYFLDGPYDTFDNIRSMLWVNRSILAARGGTAVGLGTPWYYEYQNAGKDGVLPAGVNICSWHATAFLGTKFINGEIMLACDPHEGKGFGDNGIVYFSRAEINRIFATPGTVGLIFSKKVTDPQKIQLSLLEQILGNLLELAHKLGLLSTVFPPK